MRTGTWLRHAGEYLAVRVAVCAIQAVSLETAVYKMTGLPAERFRIKERGRLVDGYAADVVIFDPAEVSDRSTWDDAWQPAAGVEKVIVNGQIVVDQGNPTGLLPGQVI